MGETMKTHDDLAGVSAGEPVCAAVKPLDWRGNGKDCWRSTGLERVYDIIELSTGRFILTFASKLVECDAIEAAKAAAQDDYEARILSAMSLRPEAEVRAEAWAAAIECAARICDIQAGLSGADDYDSGWCDCAGTMSGWIRGMITDDARAALDRIKAEARAEGRRAGMREAIEIANCAHGSRVGGADGATVLAGTNQDAANAILAAITEVRK